MDTIQIHNLSKKFGQKEVLSDVNIELNKSKIYALVGHNGAGKTTLLKHILGLYEINKQSNGSIKYFENGKKISKWKKQITYSPELYTLFEDLTVLEYINFVLKIYGCKNEAFMDETKEILQYFEIGEMSNRLIYSLSNGMKRKVAHIAALLVKSNYCILDEPFSALDPIAIYKLKEYMVKNVENQTFIISTHQLPILDSLDITEDKLVIILMQMGKVTYMGSKSELFAKTNTSTIEKAYLSYYQIEE